MMIKQEKDLKSSIQRKLLCEKLYQKIKIYFFLKIINLFFSFSFEFPYPHIHPLLSYI